MVKETPDQDKAKKIPNPAGSSSQDSLTPLQRYLAKQRAEQGAVDGMSSTSNRTPNSSSSASPNAVPNSAPKTDFGTKANTNSGAATNGKRVVETVVPLLKTFLENARRLSQKISFPQVAPAPSPTGPVAVSARVPADVGGRFGGLLVDMLILYMLKSFVTANLLPDLSYEINFFVFYLVAFPYYAWSYHAKGASIGKLVMGFQVIDVVSGQRIGIWRAFFRETLGKWISFICFGVGFFMAAFRSDRMALHDLIFETQVIRQPASNWPA
jgi:uncharacterized RDD family membrane protein YckC